MVVPADLFPVASAGVSSGAGGVAVLPSSPVAPTLIPKEARVPAHREKVTQMSAWGPCGRCPSAFTCGFARMVVLAWVVLTSESETKAMLRSPPWLPSERGGGTSLPCEQARVCEGHGFRFLLTVDRGNFGL